MRQTTRYIYILLLCVMSCLYAQPAHSTSTETELKILIFDSYHEGYSWSDQLISSITNTILRHFPQADFTIEHLDTKRVPQKEYIAQLPGLYTKKFASSQFDLIFVSDDNAINLVQKIAPTLFPTTPIVFLGYNDSKPPPLIEATPMVTGILERLDILGTITAAHKLVPHAKKLYIINDRTTTGDHSQTKINAILPQLREIFDITIVRDLPLKTITEQIAELDKDTIIYLCNYFQDNTKRYYTTEETTKTLVDAATVPIFTTYDFFFLNGVIGGRFTTGYAQGKSAADYGLAILAGVSPKKLPVLTPEPSIESYDVKALNDHKISLKNIPHEAVLTNIPYPTSKHILSIHSYSPTNIWTKNIREGINSVLDKTEQPIRQMVEFMDSHQIDSPLYKDELISIYQSKYSGMNLDAILVSNLPAFRLVTEQRERLFKDVPVIFTGLSRSEYASYPKPQGTRGILEYYNIGKSIEFALEIFPKTKGILIINDQTLASQLAPLKFLKKQLNIPEHIHVEQTGNLSLQELTTKVSHLPEDTIIYWFSFVRDKNNQRFSVQESFSMVSAATNKPIFSCRDELFGKGILGGAITSGVAQGKLAGEMVLETIGYKETTGEKKELAVTEKCPSPIQVDFRVAERFSLSADSFPQGTNIFFYNPSFWQSYKYPIIFFIIALLVFLFFVHIQHKELHKNNRILSKKVGIDPLTATKDRTFLSTTLPKILREKTASSPPVCLCYIDIDNLKTVNDSFGHNVGDQYILHVTDVIKQHIRCTDVVCRVGGDEFLILFDVCDYQNAKAIITNIAEDVEALQTKLHLAYHAGISFGISILNNDQPQNAETLIKEADQKMYVHKRDKNIKRPL